MMEALFLVTLYGIGIVLLVAYCARARTKNDDEPEEAPMTEDLDRETSAKLAKELDEWFVPSWRLHWAPTRNRNGPA